MQGKREFKYETLNANSLKTLNFKQLEYSAPYRFFVPKDFDKIIQYEKGFRIDEIFRENIAGVETVRDALTLHFNTESLKNVVNDFLSLDEGEISKKYNTEDARDWKIVRAKEDVKLNIDNPNVWQDINYRPFDTRKTFYSGKQNGFVCNGRCEVMKHMLSQNITLVFERQAQIGAFTNIFISNKLVECHIQGTMFSKSYISPLYLYPETQGQQTIGQTSERTPNLNPEIVKQIAQKLNLTFVPEKTLINPLKSSPPLQGGVPERRGGSQTINSEGVSEGHDSSLKSSPPSQGGVSEGRGGIFNNLPHLKTFRQELRHNLTPAEAKLWSYLQNSQLEGRKFRRQHSIGNYILDFYCPGERIAIELDGEVHFNEEAALRDQERTAFLNAFGVQVIRFENKLVFEQADWVLDEIKSLFGWEKTTPAPPSQGGEPESFAPIDILDYIYAVLHSPTYRDKYKEFLKIDFPRVPYPKDKKTFWQLVDLGGQIRQIHLLESPTTEKYITQYPIDGDNVVDKIRFEM